MRESAAEGGLLLEITVEISGLNLERMLTLAAQAGILVRRAKRIEARRMRISIRAQQRQALFALCERFGWEAYIVRYGCILRLMRWLRHRPTVPAAVLLFVGLAYLSSQMIWRVEVLHAGKATGEVRRYLREMHVGPGRMKGFVSVSQLRDALMLRLPDLSHVSAAYEGSTLVIDCQSALEGEAVLTGGSGLHLVAAQDGIVTRISVHSGTPMVSVGQAVRRGDLLISGEERGEKQSVHPVQAEGEIIARVWARGDARVSLAQRRTVETGAIRRRVTLHSLWHSRVIRDDAPFASQDVSREIQPVVGLYLPLYREVETMAETVVISQPRSEADAASLAQGAAQQMAKNKCPAGVEILDKSVQYSMIDNEYMYAAVVLEYEDSIAVRAQTAGIGP